MKLRWILLRLAGIALLLGGVAGLVFSIAGLIILDRLRDQVEIFVTEQIGWCVEPRITIHDNVVRCTYTNDK